MPKGVWERLNEDTQHSVIDALSQWLDIAEMFGRHMTMSAEEVQDALDKLQGE
jgi:hypothetical protein